MAKKKCKCPDGVPEWVVTFGDMMSLLLCFFILLAALSEPKQDREFQKVLKGIKEAFGYSGGSGYAPTNDAPSTSIISLPEAVALFKEKFRQVSQADDPGVTGKQTTVQSIREGLQFRIGGFLTFDPGSAEIKKQAKVELAKIAGEIRGKNNKIEIRGHASNNDLPPGSAFDDLWDLSYARAQAVKNFLTSSEAGVSAERIRVVACANNEPLIMRAYDPSTVTVNRRIEVIVTETLIQDFQSDAARAQLPQVSSHGG